MITHEEWIGKAEQAAQYSFDSIGELAVYTSNMAIYELLKERLPEPGMQVIDTPGAPQDTARKPTAMTFSCTEYLPDALSVVPLPNTGKWEFTAKDGDDEVAIYLSSSDAEVLARNILGL